VVILYRHPKKVFHKKEYIIILNKLIKYIYNNNYLVSMLITLLEAVYIGLAK